MNKTKKRLLSYLLLAIGGLNLGGVSNAQPKDSTNTSNISSEKSKRSSEASGIFNLRNGMDVLGLLAMIYGGKKLKDKNDENKDLRLKIDSSTTLQNSHDTLKNDYDNLKDDYDTLKNDYDELKKDHESCNSQIFDLKLAVGLSKTHTIKEMEKFDLLNTFQNLFRFCHSQGWECARYSKELSKEDFEDYDVIAFNTAAYEQGYANMSAYFVAKGKVNKQLLRLADGEFSKLTSVYDYFGNSTYSLENGTKKNLFKMIDGEGLDEKEVKNKGVFLISFEDLFKKVHDPRCYLDGSIKFKTDKEKFKNYYIICEAYRVPGPSWGGEYDDVYYKFLLVEKNKKGIEKEKEIKAKEKKMKKESEISDSDSDSD